MSALVDVVLMLVSLIASGAMIFGGVVPFIPQVYSLTHVLLTISSIWRSNADKVSQASAP